jgi:putative transposase
LKDKYSVAILSAALECSRSGYYDWRSLGRPNHKKFNEKIAMLTAEIHNARPIYGIERIRMVLKRKYGLVISNKTVHRYMKILAIRSVIRSKKKYGPVKPHFTPNLIKRDFSTTGPNQKWSIDVTYLNSKDGVEYLCAIKDMFDKTIIAHTISNKNDNELVLSAVNKAIDKVRKRHRQGLIIHSDQGSQFGSIDYAEKLRRTSIRRSLSFRGTCVDNSPIESFFSALKSECISQNRNRTRHETRRLIEAYIAFYHGERFQKGLNEMTPAEYRRQYYCLI